MRSGHQRLLSTQTFQEKKIAGKTRKFRSLQGGVDSTPVYIRISRVNASKMLQKG